MPILPTGRDLQRDAEPCGSWLACDADNTVFQQYRGDAIAGKPAPTVWCVFGYGLVLSLLVARAMSCSCRPLLVEPVHNLNVVVVYGNVRQRFKVVPRKVGL
ncbi:hypothetical protein FFI16_023665 [Pseudomonas sp. KBS0710]|nr:hypothetical protein FFI16_023665 [Pseudomonas sp. KBS0710]